MLQSVLGPTTNGRVRTQPCIPHPGGVGTNDGSDQVMEGYSDGGDTGVGIKLLHLLRSGSANVIVAVSCWDDGIRGQLDSERYRVSRPGAVRA